MTHPPVSRTGFLLTRQWRDQPHGVDLIFWLATDEGPLQVVVPHQETVAFAETTQLQRRIGDESVLASLCRQFSVRAGDVMLRSFRHEPVTALYFPQQRALAQARDWCHQHNVDLLEADIRPPDRYLMERFIQASVTVTAGSAKTPWRLQPAAYEPRLRWLSLDIETSMDGRHLYSIACSAPGIGQVFMIGDRASLNRETEQLRLQLYATEKALLKAFLDWFAQVDPDLILGWNVVGFDLRFLQRKCEQCRIMFSLGRGREPVEWRQSREQPVRHFVLVPGRVVLDGIDLLKAASYHFESYALDAVAHTLLQRGKQIDKTAPRGGEITRLFEQDKLALAQYNVTDCRLVEDIFAHLDLIAFACARAGLTGLPLDKTGGSVAAFENLYLPRLHRQGYVAPNIGWITSDLHAPGGYVMDSQPGLHQHVLVLDFKSLYPSIIRTFKIDPLSLIEGLARCRDPLPEPDVFPFDSAHDSNRLIESEFLPGYHSAIFCKERHLLPDIIAQLWEARDAAKRAANAPLSQAIKLIMNSFYGVLGTPLCRFFDPRLSASITRRAHDILRQTRQLIEAKGYPVIYGDTDSVFVLLGGQQRPADADALGNSLAEELTAWWRTTLHQRFGIESFLELEYETHFARFHMPTMRGSDTGSKKRYAGLAVRADGQERLIFKGLENVRTDWTPLARQFQSDVYARVFRDEPVDDLIRQIRDEVLAGERDAQLVYRKRIRKPLASYTHHATPPVQAARKADALRQSQGKAPRYQQGGWISYVMTLQGPETAECRQSPIDYQHYLDRQLAPAVDAVLACLGLSFAGVLDQQLSLPFL